MKTLLVTAIGTWSAECVVGSLRRLGYGVIGTDLFPPEYDPTTAPLCKDFLQVERAAEKPDVYCDQLKVFAERNFCENIIPLMDPEVDALAERKNTFDVMGLNIWICDSNVISLVRNKSAWATVLSSCKEFSVIPSYLSFEAMYKNYSGRYVAKKVRGRSSDGIVFGNTKDRVSSAVNLSDDYLFQPFIDGDIITVDFSRHLKSGRVISLPRQELVRTKTGGGTVVKILEPTLTQAAVEEFAQKLGISGVMNCEFIRAPSGKLYLMDINPRFSAGVSFSQKAGYDFVEAAVACQFENDLKPLGHVDVGRIIVKRYVDF